MEIKKWTKKGKNAEFVITLEFQKSCKKSEEFMEKYGKILVFRLEYKSKIAKQELIFAPSYEQLILFLKTLKELQKEKKVTDKDLEFWEEIYQISKEAIKNIKKKREKLIFYF